MRVIKKSMCEVEIVGEHPIWMGSGWLGVVFMQIKLVENFLHRSERIPGNYVFNFKHALTFIFTHT